MNIIIKNLIKDFLKNEELASSDDAKNFEDFCNFSIVSLENTDALKEKILKSK